MSVERQNFGKTTDGKEISLYTVTNKNGAVMKVTDFGAILVSVIVPDRGGDAPRMWCWALTAERIIS